MPQRDRLRWISAVYMRIGDDREKLTKAQQQRRRSPSDKKFKLRAIQKQRNKEWKATMYPKVNDID